VWLPALRAAIKGEKAAGSVTAQRLVALLGVAMGQAEKEQVMHFMSESVQLIPQLLGMAVSFATSQHADTWRQRIIPSAAKPELDRLWTDPGFEEDFEEIVVAAAIQVTLQLGFQDMRELLEISLLRWARNGRPKILGDVDLATSDTSGKAAETEAKAVIYYSYLLALLEEAGEFAAEPLLPNITLDCASTVKFVLRSAKPKKRKAAGDTVLRSGKHAVALRLAILTTQVLGSTMEQVTEVPKGLAEELQDPIVDLLDVIGALQDADADAAEALQESVGTAALGMAKASEKVVIAIMRKTREATNRVKVRAVELATHVWREIGGPLLVTLSETLLFAVELLEEEEDVERATRELITAIEAVSGESLQDKLKA
jgi:hypothetical protein